MNNNSSSVVTKEISSDDMSELNECLHRLVFSQQTPLDLILVAVVSFARHAVSTSMNGSNSNQSKREIDGISSDSVASSKAFLENLPFHHAVKRIESLKAQRDQISLNAQTTIADLNNQINELNSELSHLRQQYSDLEEQLQESQDKNSQLLEQIQLLEQTQTQTNAKVVVERSQPDLTESDSAAKVVRQPEITDAVRRQHLLFQDKVVPLAAKVATIGEPKAFTQYFKLLLLAIHDVDQGFRQLGN